MQMAVAAVLGLVVVAKVRRHGSSVVLQCRACVLVACCLPPVFGLTQSPCGAAPPAAKQAEEP